MKTSSNNSENRVETHKTIWVIYNVKRGGYFTGYAGNVLKYADFGRIHHAIKFDSYEEADEYRKSHSIRTFCLIAPYSRTRAMM